MCVAGGRLEGKGGLKTAGRAECATEEAGASNRGCVDGHGNSCSPIDVRTLL